MRIVLFILTWTLASVASAQLSATNIVASSDGQWELESGLAAETEEPSATDVYNLNRVCFSSTDYQTAQTNCQRSAHVLGLLSNDSVILSGSCNPASFRDNCIYYYGFILEARTIVVEPRQ